MTKLSIQSRTEIPNISIHLRPGQSCTIGSGVAADYCLNDASIPAIFCRLRCHASGGYIECLDATKLITVNQVEKNRSRLVNGDSLTIGRIKLDVEMPQVVVEQHGFQFDFENEEVPSTLSDFSGVMDEFGSVGDSSPASKKPILEADDEDPAENSTENLPSTPTAITAPLTPTADSPISVKSERDVSSNPTHESPRSTTDATAIGPVLDFDDPPSHINSESTQTSDSPSNDNENADSDGLFDGSPQTETANQTHSPPSQDPNADALTSESEHRVFSFDADDDDDDDDLNDGFAIAVRRETRDVEDVGPPTDSQPDHLATPVAGPGSAELQTYSPSVMRGEDSPSDDSFSKPNRATSTPSSVPAKPPASEGAAPRSTDASPIDGSPIDPKEDGSLGSPAEIDPVHQPESTRQLASDAQPKFSFDSGEPDDIDLSEDELAAICDDSKIESFPTMSVSITDPIDSEPDSISVSLDHDVDLSLLDAPFEEQGNPEAAGDVMPGGSNLGKFFRWSNEEIQPALDRLIQRQPDLKAFRCRGVQTHEEPLTLIQNERFREETSALLLISKLSISDLQNAIRMNRWNDRMEHPQALRTFLEFAPPGNLVPFFDQIEAVLLIEDGDAALLRHDRRLD